MGLKIRFVKNYYDYNYYPKGFSFQGSQQPVHSGSEGSPASLPVCLACTHPRHHPPGSSQSSTPGPSTPLFLSSHCAHPVFMGFPRSN